MKLIIYTKHKKSIKFENLTSDIISKFDDAYSKEYRNDSSFSIWDNERKIVIPFNEISYYEITK